MKVKSCVVCGKEHTRAYGKCCSKECSNILRRRTCKELYGVEVSSQNPEVKKKFQETCKELYGGHPSKTDEVKAKMKATNKDRYGVENAAQSPEIQAKIKDTNLKLYGFENVSQSPEIQERKRQTNLKNRGTEYPTQCAEVMEKQYTTNTMKYGTFCVLKNDEIKSKIKATNLRKYEREYASQSHIKNYANYTREYILDNFTTNGIVSLSQRAEMCKYYGISDESNTLRKLKEWNIPAEICQSYSFAEKRILKYLQDKYPKLTFIENDRSIIKNTNTGKYLELDIVVKKDGDIICAIEYNGIYWHDKKNQEREVRKSNLCAAQGISLFFIWEKFEEIGLREVEEFLKGRC